MPVDRGATCHAVGTGLGERSLPHSRSSMVIVTSTQRCCFGFLRWGFSSVHAAKPLDRCQTREAPSRAAVDLRHGYDRFGEYGERRWSPGAAKRCPFVARQAKSANDRFSKARQAATCQGAQHGTPLDCWRPFFLPPCRTRTIASGLGAYWNRAFGQGVEARPVMRC